MSKRRKNTQRRYLTPTAHAAYSAPKASKPPVPGPSPGRFRAIEEQTRLFGTKMLPEICIELRHAVNGAADPWPDKEIAETVRMLTMRLDTWHASIRWDQRFDDAVREMILATLELVEMR